MNFICGKNGGSAKRSREGAISHRHFTPLSVSHENTEVRCITLLFVHLADPHDSCAADGARTLQTNELGAFRADAFVAARHEHVGVRVVHTDVALARRAPPLCSPPRHRVRRRMRSGRRLERGGRRHRRKAHHLRAPLNSCHRLVLALLVALRGGRYLRLCRHLRIRVRRRVGRLAVVIAVTVARAPPLRQPRRRVCRRVRRLHRLSHLSCLGRLLLLEAPEARLRRAHLRLRTVTLQHTSRRLRRDQRGAQRVRPFGVDQLLQLQRRMQRLRRLSPRLYVRARERRLSRLTQPPSLPRRLAQPVA
eukprot:scaffold66003_cov63-Phaeocystis_antarctica.AAC.7